MEARAELSDVLLSCLTLGCEGAEAVLAAVKELPMLVPFFQPQSLAIPVCVKARVLKMAALYDLPLSMAVLEEQVFSPVRVALPEDLRGKLDDISTKIREELSSNVAEEAAEFADFTANEADRRRGSKGSKGTNDS